MHVHAYISFPLYKEWQLQGLTSLQTSTITFIHLSFDIYVMLLLSL